MSRLLTKNALLAMLAALAFAAPAGAQTPTPAGTKIKNKATAQYKDANGNTYTAAPDSVTITVAFVGALTVNGTAPAVVLSPSVTAVADTFNIVNNSNGDDIFQVTGVSLTGSDASHNATFTKYRFNGTDYEVGTVGGQYATEALARAALNTAINTLYAGTADSVVTGDSITVLVYYQLGSGVLDGSTASATLTAASRHAPTVSNSGIATSTVDTRWAASVGPNYPTDPTAQITVLPTEGTGSTQDYYEATFTIYNGGSQSATYSISASGSAGIVNVIAVDGVGGTTGSVTVAGGSSQAVVVRYEVPTGNGGTNRTISVSATNTADATDASSGGLRVNVVETNVVITKRAFATQDSTLAQITTRNPTQDIWYLITIKNTGTAAADWVEVTDDLNAAGLGTSIDLVGTDASPKLTVSNTAGVLKATLNASQTIATNEVLLFWIHVTVR